MTDSDPDTLSAHLNALHENGAVPLDPFYKRIFLLRPLC